MMIRITSPLTRTLVVVRVLLAIAVASLAMLAVGSPAAQAAAPASFSGPTNFGAGDGPLSVAAADLSIEKSGPQTATTGQPFDYTLSLTNSGPDTATNVVVEDDLPEGVTYNDAASSPSCEEIASTPEDPNDVRCTLSSLPASAGQNTATLTINVTPNQAGTLINRATLTSDAADPNPSNNTSNSTTTAVEDPDTTEPTITDLTPPPGSTTTKNGRDIEATVEDDRSVLSKEDIRLFVDGRERGRFTYDPQSGRLVFDKLERLGAGKHSVKIVATDEAGNTATERWTFRIR